MAVSDGLDLHRIEGLGVFVLSGRSLSRKFLSIAQSVHLSVILALERRLQPSVALQLFEQGGLARELVGKDFFELDEGRTGEAEPGVVVAGREVIGCPDSERGNSEADLGVGGEGGSEKEVDHFDGLKVEVDWAHEKKEEGG